MLNEKYYKKNITKEWIQKSPFRYFFTEYEEDIYKYKFPVYKNDNRITLECELTMFSNDGNIVIDVFKYNTKEKYYQFYNNLYPSNNKVLDMINKNILKEFRNIGIEKRKGVNDEKESKNQQTI